METDHSNLVYNGLIALPLVLIIAGLGYYAIKHRKDIFPRREEEEDLSKKFNDER